MRESGLGSHPRLELLTIHLKKKEVTWEKSIKCNLKEESKEKWKKEIEPLFLPNFLKLLQIENFDLTLKSIIYN